MKPSSRRVFFTSTAASFAATQAFAAPAAPPAARVDPVTDRYWGVDVVDRYRWMETLPKTAEFETWLKGQAAFARRTLDKLPARKDLAKRLERYTGSVDTIVSAQAAGGRLFVVKRPAGAQTLQIHLREPGKPERLLFDPGASGKPGGAMDDWAFSPDGKSVAISTSVGGSETGTTAVLDVETGKIVELAQVFARARGWTADGQGLFYYRVRADAVPGSHDYGANGSCWLHRLGTDPKTDIEVFRSSEGPGFETMEDDAPAVSGAPGSDWVIGAHILNGQWPGLLYVARAADLLAGKPAWRKIAGRAVDVRQVSLVGDHVYLLACGRASNGEVVRVDCASQTFETGQVVLPAGAGVSDLMATARDGLYVHDSAGGQGGLTRVSFDGAVRRITPPHSGAIWEITASRDEDGAWFHMDDLTLPASSYHLPGGADLTPVETRLVKAPPYDVGQFATTRVDAPARDGARISLDILHRTDIKRNGRNPVLIEAYGSYGSILDPGFQPSVLAFLEAGGVLVYAHVRGGGEKGEAWHKAGYKATKPNTWRDAIDSAEFLIREKWTSKTHLAIWGASAGGIMVGGAITERPDLFAAAIGEVGAFNSLRMEFTANGPGNDAEFGTVKKEDEFKALLAMDAYHKVRDGVRYPACLLLTGANDPRVEPWQVAKFAARLQAASTRPHPALLRVDYNGGHFAKTHAQANAKSADIFGFVLAHTASH